MIRKARPEDIQRIAEIEQCCFPKAEACDKAEFEKRFKIFPECFWVYELNGEIIGFVNGMCINEEVINDRLFEDAGLHQPNGDYQSVFGLDVLPDYRHHGYARELMNALIEDAKAKKRKGCILTCKDHLIGFYESFGYLHIGVSASVHGGAKWNDMILRF